MPKPSAALAPLLLAALAACAHPEPGATPVAIGLGQGPRSGDPYLGGRQALARGEIGVAVEQFRRVLRSNPESVSALNGLAIAYDEIGRFDVAQGLYRRALTAAPRSPETLNNIGRSLIRQGAVQAALPYLTSAREIATQSQITIIDANLAQARPGAASPLDRHSEDPPNSLLKRTGAREHLLRTSPAPRRLLAAEVPAFTSRETPTVAERSSAARPFLVEVSNGTGRNRMAARMALFLRRHDVAVGRLTNARSFSNATTSVLFRHGYEQDARRAAALLPTPVQLYSDNTQAADVRVLLGHDLAGFDRQLLGQGTGS